MLRFVSYMSSLQKAAAISAAVHLSLSLWLWNDWRWRDEENKTPPIIAVEVLTTADLNNLLPPKVEEKPKPKRVAPPPPAAKPKPKKAEKFKPKVKPMVKKKPPPKPSPKPPPKPKKDNRAELEKVLSGILKNVEKIKPQPIKPAQKGSTVRNLPTNVAAHDASKPLSLSQIEALQEHFAQCWTIPAGAREGGKLRVRINLKISPRGNIIRAQIADEQNLTDPFFRAAAESALRAVESPRCNKVDLPIEQYSLWKDMTLNFDPSRVLGG